MANLPDGFRIVEAPAAKKATGLPDGFRVLNAPAPAEAPRPDGWDLPYPGNPNTINNGPGTWERGMLAPIEKNDKTGEFRPAVPGIVLGAVDAIKDAFTLPGDAMQGKVPGLDPREGFREMPDELTGRAANFALSAGMGATGVPKPNPLIGAEGRAALKQAGEFDVPLTTGQASGDLRQLTREEILRQADGPAQPVMRTFDDRQREAIKSATDTVGAGFGGNPDDLLGSAVGGVKDRAQFSRERASSLYRIAEDGDLVIAADAVKAMPAFVKQRIVENPIIMDQNVTPTAVAAWKLIEEAGLNAGELNTSLKGIEQIRKRLVGLNGVSKEDRDATRTVKKAFDDWLDDSVDQALFSGDETAIDALKAARAESRNYLGITNPKPGDAAGVVIAKMEQGDVTAEQVANWLYGADIVSPNLNAPHVAGRLKGLLGHMSPEWASVRAAAWKRLTSDLGTGDTKSATMLAKRLDNFLNNKGSSLSNILFNESERNRMKALSAVLKRTITPADAKNPSRSAFMLGNIMAPMLSTIVGAAGYQMAGAGGLAAAVAVPVFRNMAKVRAAKNAVRAKDIGITPDALRALPTGATMGGGMVMAQPDSDLASLAQMLSQ